jgi:ribose transport system ATP-binding protein
MTETADAAQPFADESSRRGAPVLAMSGIHKRFSGVHALRGVTFSVGSGEVHALVGENGAGKSTLMKILSGAYTADEGEIVLSGERVAKPSPQQMIERGVAVIYQELSLASHLSVAENIYLGNLPRSAYGTVDWDRARTQASAVLQRLGFSIAPNARIDTLSVAQRQMVEIARALTRDARLIVLDEPSAVLGDAELEKLFDVIRRLSREGVSFIYISHRLKEVFEIGHRVTVLRDGAVVGSDDVGAFDTAGLVRMMVGRELEDLYPKRALKFGKVALGVENLHRSGVLHDINLSVREGEIVGICGLAGAGRTELLRAIVGADPIDSGSVAFFGKPARVASPRHAIRLGVGLLPEDRKSQGLFLHHTVAFNVTIARLRNLTRGWLLRLRSEQRLVEGYIAKLNVRPPRATAQIRFLSGGNQQKCVLAKYLNAQCKILLIDEPTRGVDVGAKREIYQLLAELADREGAAIVMVSSELPEVLGLSDRILVMRQGRLSAELRRGEASEEAIMSHAT